MKGTRYEQTTKWNNRYIKDYEIPCQRLYPNIKEFIMEHEDHTPKHFNPLNELIHRMHPCPYCHEVPIYNFDLSTRDQPWNDATVDIVDITLACENGCLTINNEYSKLYTVYEILDNAIDIWNKRVDSINDKDNKNPFGQYTNVSGKLRI